MKKTRRGHTNSKNGCRRCKERHVKCDENVPCKDCTRHNAECSLLVTASSDPSRLRRLVAKEKELKISPAMTLNSQTVGKVSKLFADENGLHVLDRDPVFSHPGFMQSLNLLHHFTTYTWETLSPDPDTREIWRSRAPEVACQHEFLMHGILAISALHLSRKISHKQAEYTLISSQYQTLALQQFANGLAEIDEQNSEAYFYLSTITFFLSVASITNTDGTDRPATPDDIVQSFALLQGVGNILKLQSASPRLSQDGPLAPMIGFSMEGTQTSRYSNFVARIDEMTDLARELGPSVQGTSSKESCILALEALRTVYSTCIAAKFDNSLHGHRMSWLWAIMLPDGFLKLISECHHVALIIIAHYAALVNFYGTVRKHWVSEGWSMKLIGMAEHRLEPRWRAWIAWPKYCVREELDVDDFMLGPMFDEYAIIKPFMHAV